MKLKDLIIKDYSLHYKRHKKIKSKREHTAYPPSLSPAREFKSAATIPIQNDAGENTQNLIDRIDSLRKEIKDLKESKIHAELQLKTHETFRVKHKLLKDEYESLKKKYEEIRDTNDDRDNTIIELTRNNTKYNERITTLQSENKSLENLLNQNRDNEVESVREFKNILNRTKKSCESQISNIEHDFETRVETLTQSVQAKDQKLQLLSNKFNDFKQSTLQKLEKDSKKKLTEKISEIQTLTTSNKDLKSTVDDLTSEKENIENKLKRTQNLVRDLQQQLQEGIEEQNTIRKKAEEQENITNSLYEERLNEKNKETEDLNKEVQKKDTEIYQLKQDALKLDTKLCNLQNKIKGIHSLVASHSEQVTKDGAKMNPTLKLVMEELGTVSPSDILQDTQNDDRLNKMSELLKENEKLEEQINQLKWDIDKEASAAKRATEDKDRIKHNYDQHLSECKENINIKNNELKEFKDKLRDTEDNLNTFEGDKSSIQKTLEKAKQDKTKLNKLLEKYKTFTAKVCTFFDYDESVTIDEELSERPLLDGLFTYLSTLNEQRESTKQKLKNEIEELKSVRRTSSEFKVKKIDDLSSGIMDKDAKIASLTGELEAIKKTVEDTSKTNSDDKEELNRLNVLVSEKNDVISNHASTLENMRSTILKLRDNLQNTFEEVKSKDEEIQKLKREYTKNKGNTGIEIDEQKLSLLNTINSHLSSVGCSTPSKQARLDPKKPKSDQLFKIIVDKIQNIKLASADGNDDIDTDNALTILQSKNAELNNDLRDMKEKLEKKEKEFMLISKQKDNLRAQLGSAVEMMNSKDNDLYPNNALEVDILPSLQSQLQTIQDDSKHSETTRDMTEQLIESFEINERKITTLVDKLKEYKDKIREQRSIIKSLKKANHVSTDTTDLRELLTKEIKKQVREEEAGKRDKEIKRQRDLLASKSEEQSVYFQSKIEELEAKIEAKDSEITDLIIKVQENESDLERLRQSKERKSVVSLEDQLNDLTSTPVKEDKSKNIDNQMKILEKVEKLDEKIIELGEKIGEYRVEVMDRIESELDEINQSDFSKLKPKALEKLNKMKETNTVIQVVRKCEVEGLNWLLLEKKDPLDKPLEIKNSNSFSKSSIENHPGGRVLFWVSEESLKADMLDYVYSFTPKFLLNSESLKLNIGDLFPDEDEKNGYKMLKESIKELQDKRNDLLKQQREIKLGLRRENFLLEDAITTETEERLRELENKNIEFEDEIQSLLEENNEIAIKNKELLEFINALNLRLKDMNYLVYDFSRDRSQEEIMKTNADLIKELDKVKNHKMMVDAELNKFKEAIEKRKIRTSRPEHKKDFDYPNSPASFDFEGDENEIFGESFVIESNNKELEEKLKNVEDDLRNVEEELRAAKQDNELKEKNIAELKETIEEMEMMPKSASIDMRKSESFEMMNNDTIQNIKATLLQFLKNVPPTEKNNELLLSVIFDMLHMNAKELQDVKESRAKISTNKDTPQKKKTGGKGLFSKLLT